MPDKKMMKSDFESQVESVGKEVVMDADSIVSKVIEKSSIVFKIKSAAPELFVIWSENMKLLYPDYPFKSSSEVLIADIKQSFSESLKSLFKKDKTDRLMPGYCETFIMGFISSNLSTGWCSEYIYHETLEYKRLMYLKATMIYLEVDKVSACRIKKLFDHLIDEKIDLEKKSEYEYKDVISLKEYKNKKINEKERFDKEDKFYKNIINYFEAILLEKHNKCFNNILDHNYYPALDLFFTGNEMTMLFDSYRREYNLSGLER